MKNIIQHCVPTGMCIKTTVSWSWPVRLRKTLMLGRPPSSELEFILNGSR